MVLVHGVQESAEHGVKRFSHAQDELDAQRSAPLRGNAVHRMRWTAKAAHHGVEDFVHDELDVGGEELHELADNDFGHDRPRGHGLEDKRQRGGERAAAADVRERLRVGEEDVDENVGVDRCIARCCVSVWVAAAACMRVDRACVTGYCCCKGTVVARVTGYCCCKGTVNVVARVTGYRCCKGTVVARVAQKREGRTEVTHVCLAVDIDAAREIYAPRGPPDLHPGCR